MRVGICISSKTVQLEAIYWTSINTIYRFQSITFMQVIFFIIVQWTAYYHFMYYVFLHELLYN